MRVAVIGAGGMGTNHLNCYAKISAAEVVGICDIRPEQTAEPAALLGAKTYTDFTAMLDEQQPDILDVCTPSYLHKEMAVEAMNRGIHVISEKPAALCEADAAAMFDCAEKNGVKFMVAHVLRFWPEYTYLRQVVEEKPYGKLVDLKMTRIGVAPAWSWDDWMMDPSRSGGVPYDLHIHDLDYMVSLLGLPDGLQYKRMREGASGRMDHVFACYSYAGGVNVFAEAAWMNANYPFQAAYLAEFEEALLEYRDGALTVYRWDREPETVRFGGEVEAGLGLPATDGYLNELRYFVERVRDGKAIDCMTREEICGVLRLIDTEY